MVIECIVFISVILSSAMTMEISQNCSAVDHLSKINVGDMLLAVNGTSFCSFSESFAVPQWVHAYKNIGMPRLICFFRPSASDKVVCIWKSICSSRLYLWFVQTRRSPILDTTSYPSERE